MSDLDPHPPVLATHACYDVGATVLDARRVYLGKTTEVARMLPHKDIRMIGAWCFLDHYGPEDVSTGPGMQVWAHPHTGLQTVSYLLEGEIEHRDTLGSQVMVRPGELHMMTAGRGIAHSELSRSDKPPTMHGLQLWVALPDASRHIDAGFVSHRDLPPITAAGVRGRALVGTVAGVTAPAVGHTPLAAADLTLAPGASYALPLDPAFEHGVLVVSGTATLDATTVGVDQLRYTPPGATATMITTAAGCRLMIIGGAPFDEEIVMWWNFVGRTHEEVAAYRQEWEHHTEPGHDRFGVIVDADEPIMGAPPMPTVALRPRPAQRRPTTAPADGGEEPR